VADPMYRQIADDLRRQIEDGSLEPGQQLRTELELREKYNASRNTVRDAVKWLITRGLVETRPGQGTFVVEQIIPFVTTLTGDPETSSGEGDTYIKEVAASLRRPNASAPRVEIQEAAGQLATELQLKHGATVVSRHQQRSIDGTPWSLQTSFYPMSLVERGALRLIQAGDIGEGTVESSRRATATPSRCERQTRWRHPSSSCPATAASPSSKPARLPSTTSRCQSGSRSACIPLTGTSSQST